MRKEEKMNKSDYPFNLKELEFLIDEMPYDYFCKLIGRHIG